MEEYYQYQMKVKKHLKHDQWHHMPLLQLHNGRPASASHYRNLNHLILLAIVYRLHLHCKNQKIDSYPYFGFLLLQKLQPYHHHRYLKEQMYLELYLLLVDKLLKLLVRLYQRLRLNLPDSQKRKIAK